MQPDEVSSSDVITSTTQPVPASQPAGRATAATVRRRADLKPTLMSHISGVHRLSGGVNGDAVAWQDGDGSSTQLPKYGVDCPDGTLLDEVNNT